MPKIFMVFLGGGAPSARVEVHDIDFVISKSIDHAHNVLRERWFGDQKGVHLDSYREVTRVEGYKVSLQKTEKSEENLKLFFVQMGGYIPDVFGEFHSYELLVATDIKEARLKAKTSFFLDKYLPHIDESITVDALIELEKIENQVIFLERATDTYEDIIHNLYAPLS